MRRAALALQICLPIPLFRLQSLVKVLERLHLLQCIFAHVQNTLPWASWETQYLKFLVLILVPAWSHAAENDQIKCVLKTLLRRSRHAVPIRRKKNTVHPEIPNSDTLVDASMTGYPIHIDQGSPKFLGEDHISYCKTIRGPDILRSVVFSGYVTFYQINRFLENILLFHYWQNVLRPDEMASQVWFVPRAVV